MGNDVGGMGGGFEEEEEEEEDEATRPLWIDTLIMIEGIPSDSVSALSL